MRASAVNVSYFRWLLGDIYKDDLSSSSVAARFIVASFLAAFLGGILKTNDGTNLSALYLYTAEVTAHTVRCKCGARTCSVRSS